MWHKLGVLLEMIQFKHTVFAMPFGLMGAFLAAGGLPEGRVLLWVVLAMVGARTCAMGFNRIVDRRFDAANPRTAARALPAGMVRLGEAWTLVVGAGVLFFYACAQLNPLTLALAPLALGLTLGYSYTKRFTWLCHLVLGAALALAPLGGWAAVRGILLDYPWSLTCAVLCWVAGFDTIYACLDADFDRQSGLFSLPARFGRARALRLAAILHLAALACFVLTGIALGLNLAYWIGLTLAGAALMTQHLLVKPDDLRRIQLAFLGMNGFIAITLFAATWIALATA